MKIAIQVKLNLPDSCIAEWRLILICSADGMICASVCGTIWKKVFIIPIMPFAKTIIGYIFTDKRILLWNRQNLAERRYFYDYALTLSLKFRHLIRNVVERLPLWKVDHCFVRMMFPNLQKNIKPVSSSSNISWKIIILPSLPDFPDMYLQFFTSWFFSRQVLNLR